MPSPKESETVWSDIWHLEAHHSTALEGNTLVLGEVVQLLDERRAVGAKPLKEYMEVEGYSDAARWVYGQALDPDDWSDGGLINLNEVRRIHHMAMTPVWGVAQSPYRRYRRIANKMTSGGNRKPANADCSDRGDARKGEVISAPSPTTTR